MRVEVLLSTMYQTNFDIVEKCNIKSDAIIINQCDEEKIETKKYPFGTIKMIYSKKRGLSNSRNLALKNASGDICILCDDDIVYYDNYVSIIKEAFNKNKEADLIVFNVKSMNTNARKQEKLFKKAKKIPFYKSYSSVHIAFKLKSIINNNILFNTDFGAGSGVYSFAEDSLFFNEVHKKKLLSLVYPAIIAKLYTEKSSWFKGYDEKYFYDLGAFIAAGYGKYKHIVKWYYPIRLFKQKNLNIRKKMYYINAGISNYRHKKTYNDFILKEGKK